MISELIYKGITSMVVATMDFVLPLALEKLEPMSTKETHPARSRVRYTWTMMIKNAEKHADMWIMNDTNDS